MSPCAVLLALALLQGRLQGTRRNLDEEFAVVELVVTALAGESAYVDRGRDAGLEPGDKLRLFPVSGTARPGKVISVSRTSARIQLRDGLEGVDVGSRAEALVPRARLRQPADANEPADESASAAPGPEVAPRVPEHPPWTQPPEDWDDARPLLAPAHGVEPEDRPRRLDGEIYAGGDWTDDRSEGSRREFASASTGMAWRLDNPFGHGGRLDLDAEYFARRSDVGGDVEDESRLRVDRLSYVVGDERGRSNRVELGRFLQNEFPELGFLDGIEVAHRLRSGHRVGASLGYQPEPDDFFSSGNDLQTALFYRYVRDDAQSLTLGTGFQKTWHQGTADRDLLVAQLELHPGPHTSLFASALVDFYGSEDALKSSGPELTQFLLSATHRTAGGHGLSLSASQFRWPDLDRNEFPDVTAEDIADDVTTRAALVAWVAMTRSVQLEGRADRWKDRDDSGGGGALRLSLRDVLLDASSLSVELFTSEGKYTTGTGARAQARKRFGGGGVTLAWDSTRYEENVTAEELLQHVARAQLDLALGRSWFLSLYAEERLGDEQDSSALGFLLQRSFD